jgi:hypothetical protein
MKKDNHPLRGYFASVVIVAGLAIVHNPQASAAEVPLVSRPLVSGKVWTLPQIANVQKACAVYYCSAVQESVYEDADSLNGGAN